jgi:T5orf172 domain.
MPRLRHSQGHFITGLGESLHNAMNPEPEPTKPRETPEQAEIRMLEAAMVQRPAGAVRLYELQRLSPIFGVPVTAEVLHRAILNYDEQLRARAERQGLDDKAPEFDWRAEAEKHWKHQPIVYYVLHGGLVKIGTSTNLKRRLESLQPEGLLAVEPGDVRVERSRHREFAEWHSHGEWFLPSSPLEAHMERLRAEHAELLSRYADWTPGRRVVRLRASP